MRIKTNRLKYATDDMALKKPKDSLFFFFCWKENIISKILVCKISNEKGKEILGDIDKIKHMFHLIKNNTFRISTCSSSGEAPLSRNNQGSIIPWWEGSWVGLGVWVFTRAKRIMPFKILLYTWYNNQSMKTWLMRSKSHVQGSLRAVPACLVSSLKKMLKWGKKEFWFSIKLAASLWCIWKEMNSRVLKRPLISWLSNGWIDYCQERTQRHWRVRFVEQLRGSCLEEGARF